MFVIDLNCISVLIFVQILHREIHKYHIYCFRKYKLTTGSYQIIRYNSIVSVVNCESPPWVPPPFEGQGDSGRVKRSSECYGDLGCFPNDYPFNNTDNALPLNPRFIRTNFQLLTTLNTRFPHELRRDSLQSLQRSRYDGSKPTIFIIHGFEQYGMVQWVVDMAKEFLKKVLLLFYEL